MASLPGESEHWLKSFPCCRRRACAYFPDGRFAMEAEIGSFDCILSTTPLPPRRCRS